MKITVFTPTYNRAYILPQLYHSLQRQNYRDFEWLIVDDGSSDNTAALVSAWQEEGNSFPIRYFHKSNEGKCQAINYALSLAQGELFFTVDSDDYLLPNTLELIAGLESTLPPDGYCGISGNLGTSPTVTPNHQFPDHYLDGTMLDRYQQANGERAFVFYTDIHRKYLYPHFENENFMTEAVVWNRMAHDGYKMRFFNNIFCIYEYQPNGLTRSGTTLFLRNPYGYGLFLQEKARFEKVSPMQLLQMWYTFTCDLSKLYSPKQIADYIHAPYPIIFLIYHVHNLIHCLKVRF